MTEDDVISRSVIALDWQIGAFQCSFQVKVPYDKLAAAFDVHCQLGRPCNCNAGALIEVPPAMARRLRKSDLPRRAAMAAAKLSEERAAVMLPVKCSRSLKIIAAVPQSIVRRMSARDFELEVPAQSCPTCTYLGQPQDDGTFAHASAEWSVSFKGGLDAVQVAFDWRVNIGDHTVVVRTDPPLNYGKVKQRGEVHLPEHFATAAQLLDVFDGICDRSLTRFGKYRPPCTMVACRLLGQPKQWVFDPADIRPLVTKDGALVDHLLVAHVKESVYVCCSDMDAWTAARAGKLGLNHFVLQDLDAAPPARGSHAHATGSVGQSLSGLVLAEPAASAAIYAVGRLVASSARLAKGRWDAQVAVQADGFEPNPWLWHYMRQRERPFVWALWTTLPLGDNWQGVPKRFLSATLVNNVLERGVFPVPKGLKRAPLAPLEQYPHPLHTPDELMDGLHPSLQVQLNRFNHLCCPPKELQTWAKRHLTEDGRSSIWDPYERRRGAEASSSLLPSAGVFGDTCQESDTESSSEPGVDATGPDLRIGEAGPLQMEGPTAKVSEPVTSDEASESDVVEMDPRELFPKDPEEEMLELLRDLHPDTYEDKFRAYKAQIEHYESCGYW